MLDPEKWEPVRYRLPIMAGLVPAMTNEKIMLS